MPALNWPIPRTAIFALSYAVALLAVTFINRRDFKRSPEKGARYQSLLLAVIDKVPMTSLGEPPAAELSR